MNLFLPLLKKGTKKIYSPSLIGGELMAIGKKYVQETFSEEKKKLGKFGNSA